MRPEQQGRAGWRALQSIGERTQQAGSCDEHLVEIDYSKELLQLGDGVGEWVLGDGGNLVHQGSQTRGRDGVAHELHYWLSKLALLDVQD